MKKRITIIVTAAVLIFASQLHASPVDLISQGSPGWDYFEIADTGQYDSLMTMNYSGYSAYTWNASYAPPFTNPGTSAFGNTGKIPNWLAGSAFGPWLASATPWQQQTSLALKKTFHIDTDPTLLSDIWLNVANDNGFVVFINGYKAANNKGDGFSYYWEYEYQLSHQYFQQGWNTIEILAVDDPMNWYSDATFFDMELTANVVPVPTTIILFVTGLAALVGIKRRTG